MKFKTFRAIAIVALLAGGAGSVVIGARSCGSIRASASLGAGTGDVPASSSKSLTTDSSTRSPALGAGEQALRDMDKDILALLARPMSGDKIKDAFPARAYKVNVYKDAGFAQANRLKIDFDRDEKADEKWTIEGAGSGLDINRQVAPNDDEKYTVEYRLSGGVWAQKR